MNRYSLFSMLSLVVGLGLTSTTTAQGPTTSPATTTTPTTTTPSKGTHHGFGAFAALHRPAKSATATTPASTASSSTGVTGPGSKTPTTGTAAAGGAPKTGPGQHAHHAFLLFHHHHHMLHGALATAGSTKLPTKK